ncbi:MAG: N-acetylmuramoyl-L-alanine amidase [Candidatus Rokubacteria bacterium]|nr:N-acetylmuramoyl-L-alanine amidase [Candidatus Rokubacteria bacterium]
MANVPPAKRRLLREAIQHNVDIAKGVRTRAPAPRRRAPRVRFWAALLVAALAYVSVPSLFVSTNQASPPRPAALPGASAQPPAAVRTEPPEIPVSPPRPLDRAAFPLSVKRVVIDPGHGGDQYGAVSRSGLSEKEFTLDIGLRLRRLLEQASFEVVMTRQTDEAIPLAERVSLANTSRADIFVSLHVNSLPARDVRPLETFYVGPTEDPHTIRLAGMENRDSGYSLADYRELLEQVYIDARRDESRRLARTVNTQLFRSLSAINPHLENRGVKTAPFVVLIGTQMPAILVEVSCVSNDEEAALLTSPEYRERIARGLLKGIRSYANTLDGSDKRGL